MAMSGVAEKNDWGDGRGSLHCTPGLAELGSRPPHSKAWQYDTGLQGGGQGCRKVTHIYICPMLAHLQEYMSLMLQDTDDKGNSGSSDWPLPEQFVLRPAEALRALGQCPHHTPQPRRETLHPKLIPSLAPVKSRLNLPAPTRVLPVAPGHLRESRPDTKSLRQPPCIGMGSDPPPGHSQGSSEGSVPPPTHGSDPGIHMGRNRHRGQVPALQNHQAHPRRKPGRPCTSTLSTEPTVHRQEVGGAREEGIALAPHPDMPCPCQRS